MIMYPVVWNSNSFTGGGATNSFVTMQTPAGTSPAASSPTDALTFASGTTPLTITGDSSTKKITFAITPGTNNYVLTTTAGVVGWAAASGSYTDPMTTIGDTIYRNGSNVTARLGIGSTSQILTVVGGVPAWANAPATGVTSVAMSVPAFLSVAGSPITSTGTLAVTLSGTALPIANGGTAKTSVTVAPTASSWAGWDSNKNFFSNNMLSAQASTATAAGTTTLTAASEGNQLFTGSTTQTVVLPDATTLTTGFYFIINNNSTGVITVNANGGGLIATMPGQSMAEVVVLTNGTSAGTWDFHFMVPNNGTFGQYLQMGSSGPIWGNLGSSSSFNNVSIIGTSGNGWINLVNQSSAPSTPSSSFTFYSNSSGLPSFLNTGGFVTSLSSAALTASRTFSFPDATGNIVIDSATQTLTNKTISGGSNTITNINGSNIASGTVGTGFGGTGLNTSTAANGTLLIGNGSGLTAATLTGGAGITVTNGTGSVSVAVTANTYVARGGDTMTGLLTLSGDPSTSLQAATKQYVDALTSGLKWKTTCDYATTANITLSGEQSIDGGATTSSSRVLVKNQSTSSQNGIYTTGAGAWTRTSDANTASSLTLAAAVINGGSTNAGKAFVETLTIVTLGTDPVSFSQFLNTTYSAGNGLSLSGTTFSVLPDGSTLSVSGSGVKVASGGITNTEVNASAAIARSKLAAGETFTGPVVESVVALTDAATITVNAASGNIFSVVLGGNRTLGTPSGATHGQKMLFIIKQDATGSRTLSFSNYAFGTDLASVTLSTAANAVDYVGVIYNSTSAKYHVIALARGYA